MAAKNFRMFRKLCGDTALQNAVIVTNRWGDIDSQVGEAREAELMSDDIFFKPVLDKGARMARHENNIPSAENVVRLVLDNHSLPLRIQEELVNEHKDISETGAGEELNREINAQIKKHQEEMSVLMVEMEQAMWDRDEETRKELEAETQRMQREIARLENDSQRLESDYKEEKERFETRLGQMEVERREETDRITAQHQQQMDELKRSLETAEASDKEKAETSRKIFELIALSMILGHNPAGFFTRMGTFADNVVDKLTTR